MTTLFVIKGDVSVVFIGFGDAFRVEEELPVEIKPIRAAMLGLTFDLVDRVRLQYSRHDRRSLAV